VVGVVPEHLRAVLSKLRRAGFEIDACEDRVTLTTVRSVQPVNITARPYPGIPTDVQAQWMALLSLARGRSTVCDRIFAGRLMHAAELSRLGAHIEIRDGTAAVTGVDHLTGAPVRASDLRASAALVLAGLAARGETIVHDAHHLDRGYERLEQKLIQLGADVRRVPSESVENVRGGKSWEIVGGAR
jgi:UDP-N-acetylglucosamine 1-carboxyvinyltransferase